MSNADVIHFATVWSHAARSRADRQGASTVATDEALCAHAPRLRRLVHRLLGWNACAHDIDDVVQDALLQAFRNREQFRGEARLSTWLTRIALSKAKNHARSARLRRNLFSWFGPKEPAADEAEDDPPQLDRTRMAMQKLRHGDREVLVLRYLEQRDVEEIAGLLGCSRAAVDTKLTRARKRLRALLEPEEAR